MAQISSAYFKYPAKELTVVGITGTAGKTSTSTILKKMIEENGKSWANWHYWCIYRKEKNNSS